MFDKEVQYENTFNDDEISNIKKEYSTLKGTSYLDHVGCPPYPNSVIRDSFEKLQNNLYGNPHSGSLSSKFCLDSVDQVRYRVLQFFNTSADEYSVIFTSGATASLKLVAESFNWTNSDESTSDNANYKKPSFIYTEDNHTSVLGMRNVLSQNDVEIICLEHEKALQVFGQKSLDSCHQNPLNSLFVYPAQSNFSGLKYPLSWIKKVHLGALNSISYQCESSNWYCLLDAASYVSTSSLDLSSVKPDFVAISFYKMFGFPTGLGALLVRNSSSHLLEKRYYGGGTVFLALSQENHHVPRAVLHERFEDGTINFLSIIILGQGFNFLERVISLPKISKHCFELARYTYYCLSRLHHGNDRPAAVIYSDTGYESQETQGSIVNFNLLRPNGEYVGFAEVLNLANLHGIHLRTGCFCNPGACRRHLQLTTNDVKKQFKSGHVCGDDNDLIEGQPTGSVRVSFGPYNTTEDVDKLLRMIVDCFVEKPLVQRNPTESRESKHFELDSPAGELTEQTNAMMPNNSLCIYFWLENVGIVPTNGFQTQEKSKEIDISDGAPPPFLSQMFLYPVKSCGRFCVKKWEISSTGLKYDREWMITDEGGVALTQKSEPKLCLIRPVIDLEHKKLFLTYEGNPTFVLDLEKRSEENCKENKEAWLCSSKVCSDEIRGVDCGEEVSAWLSRVLGRPSLRLIRQGSRSNKGEALSLSNQGQYLLINKTSVDWLAEKLKENADCKKESMVDRFRSNFVITGLSLPFEEQLWKKVTIGSRSFKVDGPCSRCQMICIDQDSGLKTKEPLTTLAASFKGKLKFGIYLSSRDDSPAVLTVGDPITFEKSE